MKFKEYEKQLKELRVAADVLEKQLHIKYATANSN